AGPDQRGGKEGSVARLPHSGQRARRGRPLMLYPQSGQTPAQALGNADLIRRGAVAAAIAHSAGDDKISNPLQLMKPAWLRTRSPIMLAPAHTRTITDAR